jgi:cell division protein FtsQ
VSLFTRGTREPTRPQGERGDDPLDERTVRTVRRRFVRRQWARRWLAWRRVVTALVLLALVAGGVWLVFFSSALAVSGVAVRGTQQVPASVVRRAAAVPTGSPLATADLRAVAARVEGLPAVASADVSRAWPDKVRIDVTERTAVAVVEKQGGGALQGVDATGVLFRGYARRPPGLPLVRRAGTTDADALAEAARVAGSLPSGLAAKVARVDVLTVDKISLRLRSGPTVLWGGADQSPTKARVLDVLLRQHASYYDVSVPGQPLIKK